MDGKQLAQDWLKHTDAAFQARTEKTVMKHFDRADKIIKQVRENNLEDDFDAVIWRHGYKSVKNFAAYFH